MYIKLKLKMLNVQKPQDWISFKIGCDLEKFFKNSQVPVNIFLFIKYFTTFL